MPAGTGGILLQKIADVVHERGNGSGTAMCLAWGRCKKLAAQVSNGVNSSLQANYFNRIT